MDRFGKLGICPGVNFRDFLHPQRKRAIIQNLRESEMLTERVNRTTPPPSSLPSHTSPTSQTKPVQRGARAQGRPLPGRQRAYDIELRSAGVPEFGLLPKEKSKRK